MQIGNKYYEEEKEKNEKYSRKTKQMCGSQSNIHTHMHLQRCP